MDKDFYSLKEFASKIGVCEKTISRAIKKGRISCFRPGSKKGHIRIPHSEINRLAVVDLESVVDILKNKDKNT